MQSSYFFFSFFMEQWVLVCIYLGGYIFSIINPPFYMTISNWARLPFFQFFFFSVHETEKSQLFQPGDLLIP